MRFIYFLPPISPVNPCPVVLPTADNPLCRHALRTDNSLKALSLPQRPVPFPKHFSVPPRTSTGNLWSARFMVQTWAVKEGLRPAVSFMIDEKHTGVRPVTHSTISLPRVLCGFSRLSLVILQLLLATTVEVCGRGWEQVISREVRHARQLPPACFFIQFGHWTKTTRIHNKPSGHQVLVCHDCLGPCQRGYKPAVFKLHVCWPDASVVADLSVAKAWRSNHQGNILNY